MRTRHVILVPSSACVCANLGVNAVARGTTDGLTALDSSLIVPHAPGPDEAASSPSGWILRGSRRQSTSEHPRVSPLHHRPSHMVRLPEGTPLRTRWSDKSVDSIGKSRACGATRGYVSAL